MYISALLVVFLGAAILAALASINPYLGAAAAMGLFVLVMTWEAIRRGY
jgi:hypothetical protein